MLLVENVLGSAKIEESNRSKLPEGVLLRVTYPICNIGELNANNRMYERDVWEAVGKDESINEKMANRALFGQAEHPEETMSDLQLTSHVIFETWIDDSKNITYQRLDVLDTPMGRIIETLLKAGCGVGMSTRAEGDLEDVEGDIDEATGKPKIYQKVIAETYRYVTTDFTADPSTFGAVPQDLEFNLCQSVSKSAREGKMNLAEKKFATKILEGLRCLGDKCGADSCKIAECLTEINEGEDERGVRDGSGPYKDSAQRSISKVGKRKQAGEICPEEVDETELDETEDIASMYSAAGLPAPEGKGVHTKAFHKLAIEVAKGYKEEKGVEKAMELGYATAMDKLGKEKAVKAGHRSDESVNEGKFEDWFAENENSEELQDDYANAKRDMEEADSESVPDFKTWARGRFEALQEQKVIEGGSGLDLESVLKAIDNTSKINLINKLYGSEEDYIDTPGYWKEEEGEWDSIFDFMKKNMSSNYSELISWIKSNSDKVKSFMIWYESVNESVSEKQAPTCSKCNKAHWPFQKCGGEEKAKDGKDKEAEVDESKLQESELDRLKRLIPKYGFDTDPESLKSISQEIQDEIFPKADAEGKNWLQGVVDEIGQMIALHTKSNESKIDDFEGFKAAVGVKDEKEAHKLWKDFKSFDGGEAEGESERFEVWMRKRLPKKYESVIDEGHGFALGNILKDNEGNHFVVKELFNDGVSLEIAGDGVGALKKVSWEEAERLGLTKIAEALENVEGVVDANGQELELGDKISDANKEGTYIINHIGEYRSEEDDYLLTVHKLGDEPDAEGLYASDREVWAGSVSKHTTGYKGGGPFPRESLELANEMIDLQIKEATYRAELESALAEISNMPDWDIQCRILHERLNKANAQLKENQTEAKLKEELTEVVDTKLMNEKDALSAEIEALRGVLEKKAALVKETQKKLDEAKEHQKSLDVLNRQHQAELIECANNSLKEGRKEIIEKYFNIKVEDHRLEVDENSKALLENCEDLQEVDSLVERLVTVARKSALHSKPFTSVEIREAKEVVDPEQKKADAAVGHLMNRM